MGNGVSHSGPEYSPIALTGISPPARPWYVLAVAVLLIVCAYFVSDMYFAAALGSVGITLALLPVLWRWQDHAARRPRQAAAALADGFSGRDGAPGFVTDAEGEVLYRNPAAVERFGAGTAEAQTLVRALGELFADPSAVIYRLLSSAEARGSAREDVVTRRGHVRISTHGIGANAFFWRFDEMEERGLSRGSAGGSLPFLTVGRNGTILFMNDAARHLLGGRAKTLDGICEGKWDSASGLVTVSGSDGRQVLRALELESKAGRREIYLLPLLRGDSSEPVDRMEFDALPVAVLQLTPDGHVQRSNRLARDLLGVTVRDVNLADCVEGPGRPLRDWLEDVAAGRVTNRAEVLRAAGADSDAFLQIALKRVITDGEVGLVAVLHDATELKTLEAQFVQSQKMQAIGQLAGGVAHDFNNLLTAISGHCDLLLLRHDQDDLDYGDLMQIHQNANRAAFLVGQLLAFSRKQTLRPELLDLRDILTDLTHLLNRLVGERVTLVLSHDPDLPAIRADKRQLEQVIMNLVVNARDAMQGGGEIRIETASHHLKDDLTRNRAKVPAGDYVVVRVLDEGSGIAPDKIDKIFEPFYTTKPVGEGTGLGLSTAYGIVKQSGGYIFVDSTLGSGTCFTLYFPARDDVISVPATALEGAEPFCLSAEARIAPPQPDDHPLQNAPSELESRQQEGVVLLVEDEAPVRAFASRALRMRGYTVLEADCAEAALRTLEDEAISVDVFVTDVVMPGLDGPSWVREALKSRPGTHVVFVSGYAEETLRDMQGDIPNSVFLPKPFSLNELTSTVQSQMA